MNYERFIGFGDSAPTPAEYHRYTFIRRLHCSGNVRNRWGREERAALRELNPLVKGRRLKRLRDRRRTGKFLDWLDRFSRPICWAIIIWCVVLVVVALP